MTWKSGTRLFILVTALAWIAYDLLAYFKGGNPATESATIYVAAYHIPGISFICGVLVGHFFFEMHEPTEFPVDDK